jgi:2-oxoglutarate dehydrogenase E2 component (dihydrolipoamide succinyltransferase)
MGDSITEGTLVSVEKGIGDAVAQDEVIAVIETDKVNVEVRAPYAGILTAVLAVVDTDGKSLLMSEAHQYC